jgi:hypothetical protein
LYPDLYHYYPNRAALAEMAKTAKSRFKRQKQCYTTGYQPIKFSFALKTGRKARKSNIGVLPFSKKLFYFFNNCSYQATNPMKIEVTPAKLFC